MNKMYLKEGTQTKMSGPRGWSLLVFTTGFLVMKQREMFLFTKRLLLAHGRPPQWSVALPKQFLQKLPLMQFLTFLFNSPH